MNYREVAAVSASALKKFDFSPKLFHETINNNVKFKKTEALDFGSLLHDMVLTPHELPNKYVFGGVEKPIGQMGELCIALYKHGLAGELGDKDEIWQKCYDEVGFKKDKLDVVKEKFKTIGQGYFDLLVASENKRVVSTEEKSKADSYYDRLKTHSGVNSLFFGNEQSNNELEIYWKWEGLDAKSMLDRVVFTENKAKIIDLKTTSKQVYCRQTYATENPYHSKFTGFIEDVFFYDYLLQMAFYRQALQSLYPNLEVEVYLVPVNEYQTTAYKLPERWLSYADKKLSRIRQDIQFYLDTNCWDMSKHDFENGYIDLGKVMI